MSRRRFGCFRVGAFAILAFGALIAVFAVSVAISNRDFPAASAVPDRLSAADKGRIAEARNLRQRLGAAIWPAWDRPEIPIIVYNESYAFLVGYPDPPAGWLKVPSRELRGRAWELVPDDAFAGEAYYRQRLEGEINPEAFTVIVGSRWVASVPSLEWFRISLANRIRSEVPAPFSRIIPFRPVTALFIGGSDGWITLLLHETFHAWQGTLAPERIEGAERAAALEDEYEARFDGMKESWRDELAMLRSGADLSTAEEARELARQFLAHRDQRRENLTGQLVDYERRREWLEGLAKYVEIVSWREAGSDPTYRASLTTEEDPDFANYRGFERKWTRERNEMKRAASAPDVRFYYSGMAQAMLLDRIDPGWKERAISGSLAPDQLIEKSLEIVPETTR